MKIRAKEREFSMWQLFCHDSCTTDVMPFDQHSLAEALDKLAEALYPNMYVRFVSMEESLLDQWMVEFNENRWDFAPSGKNVFECYPRGGPSCESKVRRAMPKALRDVLERLDGEELEL